MSVAHVDVKEATSGPSSSKSGGGQAISSTTKCASCGSTSIDIDPSRAEAVCTNCGDVLEANLIVSDIQFEENAHGGSSAIGQFVSADSKGGSVGMSVGGRMKGAGGGYMGMSGRESREITLRNAKNKIRALGAQLSLRQDRIEMAFNFFRMALNRNLTRGRKSTHVIAACVYITCRTEGTSHMLIDFSDILQIDVYELGRTYLKLSQELCINIPVMDPCLYVMRFAHKLEFGDKTHEVSMTALRLVSRMKKDWIHFGRRPSGLCGAALLIASRLHSFHRTVTDVIRVVKVHESTLRKRLNEFGETPASQLTLDEFMNVDLDAMTEEQDPPSFKAARKRDRERMMMLDCDEDEDFEEEMSELEAEIERQLEERRTKMRGPYAKFAKEDKFNETNKEKHPGITSFSDSEASDAEKFITEQTMGTISEIVNDSKGNHSKRDNFLMPPPPSSSKTPSTPKSASSSSPAGLGLKDTIQEYLTPTAKVDKESEKEKAAREEDEELDLTGIDDDEIESYIMSESEIKCKTDMWMRVNAEYLKEKAEKEERERKEEEEALKEGREVKKRKRQGGGQGGKKQKVNLGGNQTALEAIEKIVQEKKISTKINYDVLRSLNMVDNSAVSNEEEIDNSHEEEGDSKLNLLESKAEKLVQNDDASDPNAKETIKKEKAAVVASNEPVIENHQILPASEPAHDDDDDIADELDEDLEDDSHLSAAQLLSKHRGEDAEEFYDEEEEYF